MCILLRRLRRQVLSSKSTKAEKSSALLCQMFDIIHKKRPQAGENTNERFPSDMLSRDPHVCTSTKFALVQGPNCTPKVPNFGFGSHHAAHTATQCCQKNSRKRERQSTVAPHTNARAEGRRERKSSGFNHEEVQREFVSKLTRYE